MVKVFKYYNDLFFYHLAEFCLSTVYLQLFHSDIPEEKMNYFFPFWNQTVALYGSCIYVKVLHIRIDVLVIFCARCFL